jgi:hypothetical protein
MTNRIISISLSSASLFIRINIPASPAFGVYVKWPRYQIVISLETHVGITSQIDKWANTDPRTYRRWDQVTRRSSIFDMQELARHTITF